MDLLLLLAGLVAGALIGLLAGRTRSSVTVARLSAEHAAVTSTLAEVRAERDDARTRLDEAIAAATAAERESAETAARAGAERRAAAAREADLEKVLDQLRTEFQALSAQALTANSEQFLTIAKQTLSQQTTKAEGDLAQQRQAVEHLVAPVAQALEKVTTQVEQLERERRQAFGGLMVEVERMRSNSDQLRQETAALVTALRKPQARGSWGEMQLQRVVEIAGMLEHCDFSRQVSTTSDDGLLRPDMVVRLAGGKEVVVDAKAPLDGYLEIVDAVDEASRRTALTRHARHVRTHVEQLAKKAYDKRRDDCPEFVVLFLPGESLLSAALDGDPGLLEYGAERSVLIATPTTLIAMLRTVSYSLGQERLAANAREVRDLGRELYERLSKMGGHVTKLGRALDSAVTGYNQMVGTLESRVFVTARKIAACGVTEGELATPATVEGRTREPVAEELLTSALEARELVVLPSGPATPAVVDDEMRRAAGLD
jgi:DNA recombination protein RmuC